MTLYNRARRPTLQKGQVHGPKSTKNTRQSPRYYLPRPDTNESILPDTLWTSHAGDFDQYNETHTQETAPQLQDVFATARPNLNDDGIQEWEELTDKYKDVFATDTNGYGQTDRMYHRIDPEEAWQIRQPLRWLPI
jgi:hypothetical protein